MDKWGQGMTWQTPKAWVAPRKPLYTQGYLIIETDDGFIGNYDTWLPLVTVIAAEYTTFFPPPSFVCCPAVNSATIGGANKLTPSQLVEMSTRWGWEIMSHGKHHASLGCHPLTSNASAGQKRIDVNSPAQLTLFVATGYTYTIKEGQTEETIKIATKSSEFHTAGHITTVDNLHNSYTTAATVQLTEVSIREELAGDISAIAEWGINAANYAYTYHSGLMFFPNPQAQSIVAELYDSARGIIGDPNDLQSPTFDPHKLETMELSDGLTTGAIDAALDTTAAGDDVMIWYGHGEATDYRLSLLRHLIRGATDRGIKIITRRQAIALFHTGVS